MIGLLILVAVSLIFMNVRSKFLRYCISMSLFIVLGIAHHLGWERIEPRLVDFMQGLKGRSVISEVAIKMIDEYPAFGSGPGSFEALAQFELGSSFTVWESWVHNDYLEFYLTFGKAGGSLMCCTLFFLTVRATLILFFKPQKAVTWFGLMSLLGVGIHAAGDFPLQTLSILIPVCILSTLLTVSHRQVGKTASAHG